MAGETETSGKPHTKCNVVHHKSHTNYPASNPVRCDEKPVTDQVSDGRGHPLFTSQSTADDNCISFNSAQRYRNGRQALKTSGEADYEGNTELEGGRGLLPNNS
jgi:hypothetical protein